MAVTYITRIYATIENCIDYIVRDKKVLTGERMQEILKEEALKNANDYLENALDYIGRDKILTDEERKVEIRKTLTSTINCTYDRAKEQFRVLRDNYSKESQNAKGRGKGQKEILGYHVWQSFEETIDPKLSNEIGLKLAKELFGDYQCVVSTHCNTEHTHNHIVFNAVNIRDGKKYNICTANTRKIREVSDRLCEEYGLSVLQASREMKLKWYRDGKGDWRYFEPTDRKTERRKGEFSKTSDYRNYKPYRDNERYRESNCSVIRRDIDRFLPMSKSLSELIQNLENIGYEVKNLNSKGEDLKYISFKAPGQEKFTRGSSTTLGKEYTRESIEKRISERNNEQNKTDELGSGKEFKKSGYGRYRKAAYRYGEIDIESIDEEHRREHDKDNRLYLVPRSDIERYVLIDTKVLNRNVESIYKKSGTGDVPGKKPKPYTSKAQYHIDRINENLRALNFIEEKKLRSFEQINATVQALYEKRREVDKDFVRIKDLLKQMNIDIVMIRQYNLLKMSIENNKDNRDYEAFEQQGEEALLRKYEDTLKTKKLFYPEEQAGYLRKYDEFNERFRKLAAVYDSIEKTISEYDSTVRVINRIDGENERRYGKDIKFYYDTKSKNKKNLSLEK